MCISDISNVTNFDFWSGLDQFFRSYDYLIEISVAVEIRLPDQYDTFHVIIG